MATEAPLTNTPYSTYLQRLLQEAHSATHLSPVGRADEREGMRQCTKCGSICIGTMANMQHYERCEFADFNDTRNYEDYLDKHPNYAGYTLRPHAKRTQSQ